MGFRHPDGSRKCRAASEEVSGDQGKPRAPERWPESSGRSLEEDFQVETFSVKSSRFLRFLGRSRWFEEVSSGVPGGSRRLGEGQSSRTVA